MRISGSQTHQFSEHLQQVEELLDPIRYDRSIDDAERRRLISEVLATANARALSLHAARRCQAEAAVPSTPEMLGWPRHQWGLARTG